MDHLFWLSILGAFLALDHAMVGQFMFAQPLVVGGLFGMLLGDFSSGVLAGALVQLLWINILPVGAYVPSDYTVTGGMTAALTIWLVRSAAMAIGPAMALALLLSIPAGIVSGKLDIWARHLNSRLAAKSETVLELQGIGGITRLNLLGLVSAFVRNWILYLLWLGPVAVWAVWAAHWMPPYGVHALTWIFWLLPALSVAVLLDLIAKEESRWWIVASFIAAGGLIWLWPERGMIIFTGVLSVGAIWAWRRRTW